MYNLLYNLSIKNLLVASMLVVLYATPCLASDAQQTIDYQKQYEEYQKQLKVYNEQMEQYKQQLREHQQAPLDNDATYSLPGQYTAGKQQPAAKQQQPQQQYTPQQQYYQQYDYYDDRQKAGKAQPTGHLPNYYY